MSLNWIRGSALSCTVWTCRSVKGSLLENTNLLLDLLKEHISAMDWQCLMVALHSCIHGGEVCSLCMPYLPELCYLHLVKPSWRNMRLKSSWSPQIMFNGYYHNMMVEDLSNLYYTGSDGRFHIVECPPDDYTTEIKGPILDLFWAKCTSCRRSTLVWNRIKQQAELGCSNCTYGSLRFTIVPRVKVLGSQWASKNNIQNLLSRPGSLVATSIEDPNYTLIRPSKKFKITLTDVDKVLAHEHVNSTQESITLQAEDYLYTFGFCIETREFSTQDEEPPDDTHVVHIKGMEYRSLVAVRHDLVANGLIGTTDVNFSVLGINSSLTPDAIDVIRRSVLELSTNASGSPKSMESSYLSKRIQYENICQDHSLPLFILVVSPDSTLTNMDLPREILETLSYRCRVGINLESSLEEAFDIRLSGNDEEHKSNATIREQFRLFSESVDLPESYHFNKELISLSRPLNELEEEHVKRIYQKTLTSSLNGTFAKPSGTDLKTYLSGFTDENSQKHKAAITIFPMVIVKNSRKGNRGAFMEIGNNINVPDHIYNVAKLLDDKAEIRCEQMIHPTVLAKSRDLSKEVERVFDSRVYNATPSRKTPKHLLRETYKIFPTLSERDTVHLALKGVGGKALSEDSEVIDKQARKKKSFHPTTDTSDIADYWARGPGIVHDETWINAYMSDDAVKLTLDVKMSNAFNLTDSPDSIELLKVCLLTENSFLGDLVTDICTEITMEYKVPTKENEWLIKPLQRHKALLFLKCTGSHTFFMLAFSLEDSRIIDTGHIGPRLYRTQNYIISDITSITEGYLEHFVKAGSYVPLLACSLLSTFQVNFLTPNWSLPVEFSQTFNYLTLTYLNNKIDHEEMLTNLRFLYMKMLQDVAPNCRDYVERMPTVLRSRMSVFSLNRILGILKYYETSRITRRKEKAPLGNEWSYRNLRVIYHNSFVSLEQLVESFYYSYVITKNKSAMGDHTFQIFNKVLREQVKGFKSVELKGINIWSMKEEPIHHCWDYTVERKKLDLSLKVLKDRHGPNVKSLIHDSVWRELSRITFTDLSTLKASAKDYRQGYKVPDFKEGMTRSEYIQYLKKENKHLKGKRPRVITKLVNLIEEYQEKTGDRLPTPIKLALWCTKTLLSLGFVLCDLFIKDQHNGVREIHVLEIMARVMQFVSEKICKAVNRFFENDTVSSPHTKKHFYNDHLRESEAKLSKYVSVNKSADASKWCQRNHPSQFFYDLYYFCPPEARQFIYIMYYLWTKKRIALSPELIDNLDRNRNTYSTNPDYIYMRDAFHKGLNPFLEPRSPFIETPFGMWQGIPHEASCLKHNLEQTAWKALTQEFLRTVVKIPSVITIVQGSDDSGALISVSDPRPVLIVLLAGLLWWKEALSEYSSIWVSKPKSSVATVNLIEYNSDWWHNGKNIKPVFRWSSACLETPLVERLAERPEQYYNAITQCLESGGSLMMCAVFQMLQSIMHYRLIGIGTHTLSKENASRILESRNISLGYYPLEVDQLCGITGFDYQLYLLARQGVRVNNWEVEMRDSDSTILYDARVDKVMRETLQNYSVKFSNVTEYMNVLKKTGLPKVDSMMEKIKTTPELLYANLRTWEQDELKMVLMLDNPKVKSSLSGHQPLARMMSSSAYILNTPCVSAREPGLGWVKKSLSNWLEGSVVDLRNRRADTNKSNYWFCNQDQYNEFTEFLVKMKDSISYQTVDLRRTARVDVLVWGSKTQVDLPLMDVIKRQWFKMKTVSCSRTAFKHIWSMCKVKFPFLRDTYQETASHMGMEDLSIYRMLQSISNKSRTVRLSDTSGKSGDVWSTASRIFWPKVKVRASIESSESGIRELKNGLHCILSYFFKKHKALQMCTDLIKENQSLLSLGTVVPSASFRLKIFQDVLLGKPKWQIIERIERGRLGVIGYFSRRQPLISGRYSGTGEWQGLVNSVPCLIKMLNQELEYVKVQRLTDIEAQSKSLNQLIKEFRLTFPKTGPKSRSNLYILEGGKLEREMERPENSVPFLIDKAFKPDIKTKILSQTWSLDSEGDTIRLVFSEQGENRKSYQYTILSESYTGNHWDPLLPAPYTGDENFRNWCRGVQVKPLTLLSQLMFPKETVDVRNVKPLLQGGSYTRPETDYSLPRFMQQMGLYLERKISGSTFNELKYSSNLQAKEHSWDSSGLVITEESIKNIKDNTISFLLELSEGNDRAVDEVLGDSWEELAAIRATGGHDSDEGVEESEEETIKDAFDEPDSDGVSVGMNDIRDMFENNDYTLDDSHLRSWLLHKSNSKQIDLFLGPFLDLLDDMPNSSEILQELKLSSISDQTKLQGIGGAIVYLVQTKGEYVGSYLTQLGEALEVAPIGDFISQSSAQGNSAMDLDQLKKELSQINELIPNLSGPLKNTMELRRKRLTTEIAYNSKLNEMTTTGSQISSLNKSVFILELYKSVVRDNLWEPPTLHPNEKIMAEILVSYSLDKCQELVDFGLFSAREAEVARATAWTGSLTEEFVRLLCLYLGLNLTVRLDAKEVFSYSRGMLRSSLDLNIQS